MAKKALINAIVKKPRGVQKGTIRGPYKKSEAQRQKEAAARQFKEITRDRSVSSAVNEIIRPRGVQKGTIRGPYKKSGAEHIAESRVRLWAETVLGSKFSTAQTAIDALIERGKVKTASAAKTKAKSYWKVIEQERPQVSTAGRRMKFGEVMELDEFGRSRIAQPKGSKKDVIRQQMTEKVEAIKHNTGHDSPYANVTTKMFENIHGPNDRGEKIFDRLEMARQDGKRSINMKEDAHMIDYNVSAGMVEVYDPVSGTRHISLDEYDNWLEEWRDDFL